MTMKNDTKFEEELTCQFKIDTRNLTNLTRARKNPKNLHFNRLLLMKVCMPELKKYRGVMFDGTEVDAKFGGKWLVLSKNFRLMAEK